MKKVLIAFALAGVLLAGCGGDDGSNVSSLRKRINDAPQTEVQAPPAPTVTPDLAPAETQPQYIEVTRETVRSVPVEVTRIVEVTPAPDIQGFAQPAQSGVTGYADASTCAPTQPQDAPRAGGVDRVVGCAVEWNKAYEVKP